MNSNDALLAAEQRQFRETHEADWQALEALLRKIEGRWFSRLSSEDAMRLPVLYRATLSSLAIARETSLDRALTAYLEYLCTRAYFIVYGVHSRAWDGVKDFFVRGWPAAVRSLWKETWVSFGLMLAGVVAGYVLAHHDPEWFNAIMSPDMVQGRTPEAGVKFLHDSLYGGDQHRAELPVFAASLFTSNSQVSFGCFGLGFAFGLPTAFLLVQNGAGAGALYTVYGDKGLGISFIGWLFIHGSTELFAIILAGAAGFRIGMATAFPGAHTRLDAATKAGKNAGVVMIGVVIMLLCAGLLEGIGRQVIKLDWLRYAIGGGMLTLWLSYFYLTDRRRVKHDL